MATPTRPLTRPSITAAHTLIQPYIHTTPLLTNNTLNTLASTPQSSFVLLGTPWEGQEPARPTFRFFFKAENFQRIGAFKVRGAFHALLRLVEEQGLEEVRKKGVVAHSSGNHAQALALAALTLQIPAHIVMPRISTPSKIAGTRSHNPTLYFSGSTSEEREAVVADVIEKTGATLVPPYDHPDIMLGQGTMALEVEMQIEEMLEGRPELGVKRRGEDNNEGKGKGRLDALIAPCGGGGMLSGLAIALHGTRTLVFGAEPSYQGADDARRSLLLGERISTVKSLTIADGLRTPLGIHTYGIIVDPSYVAGVYAVTEQNIRDAMRLVLERMKCVVEPSGVVGLAVCLYNEEFRRKVEREGGEAGWNVGVVFSGGNTTVEAISKIFKEGEGENGEKREREAGMVGSDGRKEVENIAG